MKIKLNSIGKEVISCRKANAKADIGDFILHLHHEIIGETLNKSIEDRISYILSDKPIHEQALRLRLMHVITKKQIVQLGEKNSKIKKAYEDEQKAIADRQKAIADWQNAFEDWQKANADWQKAGTYWRKVYEGGHKAIVDWQKAYEDSQKIGADKQKAYADWDKACADWQKAYEDSQKIGADKQKAYADWDKACADRRKADVILGELLHEKLCVKNCPWNGKTIFPKG